MPPKVSVNICCYNSEKFIKETIESVEAQTFNDYEVIIIDDGSKDRTGEIVKSIKDPRMKYYYQDNKGLSVSRNRAIELSNGEFIAFLDHDDLWEKDKLEKQIALFKSKPDLGLVYSDCYVYNMKNKKKIKYSDLVKFHRGKVIDELFYEDFMPLLMIMIKKEIIKEIGGFNENLQIAEDYDFLVRLAEKYEVDYVPEPLGTYLMHEANSMRKKIRLFEEEIEVLSKYRDKFKNIKDKLFTKQLLKKHQEIVFMHIYENRSNEARNILNKMTGFSSTNLLLRAFTYIPNWISKIVFDQVIKVKINSVFE